MNTHLIKIIHWLLMFIVATPVVIGVIVGVVEIVRRRKKNDRTHRRNDIFRK